MKLLYLSAHSILEYDTFSLFTEIGLDVFSLGAYFDPRHPQDDKRPGIEGTADHQALRDAVNGIENPKASLPDALVDWCDVVYADAYPQEWIIGNWAKIKNKRVIWRTIGQSNVKMEADMKVMREQGGVQIVRYSPNEKKFFEAQGSFAGQDAVIRFHKDPAEFKDWTGVRAEVGQVSQHDAKPHGRDLFTNWAYFEAATQGLPCSFAGPNSEKIGGLGNLGYEEMKAYLRSLRAYCYTGTVPASYTLGLIEAMMTGVPVVSLTKGYNWAGPELFEGDEIAMWAYTNPLDARKKLQYLLEEPRQDESILTRMQAVELFGKWTVMEQWRRFLG